ncbi:hypothetical protein LINGRAPRIM_LOCUS2611 [Linum grandiflorum]
MSSSSTTSAGSAPRNRFPSRLLLKSICISTTLGICQVWLCMEKRSGTSFHRETGSIPTDPGRIVPQLLVIGRLPELTSRLVCRDRSQSRRRWCFTLGKLPRVRKPTGLCTNIASPIPINFGCSLTIGCCVGFTTRKGSEEAELIRRRRWRTSKSNRR